MNRNQPNQPRAQNEIVLWYKSMPPCTRFLFTSFIVLTVTGNFGIINPRYFLFYPRVVFSRLEIWRLFTSFFLQGFNLNGALQLYFMYTYSKQMETTKFAGRTADYVYFLLFEGASILMCAWYKELMLLNNSLVMSIIYLWSQYYSDVIVNFIFGLRFQGKYLPYVLVAYEALQMGELPWGSLIGLFSGHAYHYLTETYPANGGPRLLTTPRWLYSIFPPSSTPTSTTFGTIYPGRLNQQQQQQSSRAGGNPASATSSSTRGSSTTSSIRNWGRGQRLDQ